MSGISANLLLSYPRTAVIGRRYAVTVDLQHERDRWPLPTKEEYAVRCVLRTDAFSCETEGDGSIVLHRFGGSYGPARFILKPLEQAEAARVAITLLAPHGGVLLQHSFDPIRIDTEAPPQPVASPVAQPHGKNDWAVVIGLTDYPQVPLRAPANDASAFRDWLVSPDGGALPQDHVELVLSTSPQEPDANTIRHILANVGGLNSKERRGRRLYVYAAGHGLDLKGTPLFAASNIADLQDSLVDVQRIVLEMLQLDWFEEAVVLLDIDRTSMGDQSKVELPPPLQVINPARPRGWLFGTATQSGEAGYEYLADGVHRSPFSRAVLEGLWRGRSGLRASELVAYVHKRMSELMRDHDLPDQQPSFEQMGDLTLLPGIADAPLVHEPVTLFGVSDVARELARRLEEIARSDVACLITGEPGVGKSAVARWLQRASSRREQPFVTFQSPGGNDIAALRAALEEAKGGTLAVEAIETLSRAAQEDLRGIIERRSDAAIVRIVADSETDLTDAVKDGTFSRRLHFILMRAHIHIPPLRERREDIRAHAAELAADAGFNQWGWPVSLDESALSELSSRRWRGNVRELGETVFRAVRAKRKETLSAADFEPPGRFGPGVLGRLDWPLWPNGSTLQVHFLNGSTDLHEAVISHFQEWSRYANTTFEPVDDENAPIRVKFSGPAASAYRGTIARRVEAPSPTVFFDPTAAPEQLRAEGLRVAGQVLGLIHETQNPSSSIRWDINAVLEAAQTTADVEGKYLSTFIDVPLQVGRETIRYRPFDRSSIMMPVVPRGWTLDGFATDGATELSDSDIAFIRRLYPPDTVRAMASPSRDVAAVHSGLLNPRESHRVDLNVPAGRVDFGSCAITFEATTAALAVEIISGSDLGNPDHVSRLAVPVGATARFMTDRPLELHIRLHASETNGTAPYEITATMVSGTRRPRVATQPAKPAAKPAPKPAAKPAPKPAKPSKPRTDAAEGRRRDRGRQDADVSSRTSAKLPPRRVVKRRRK